MQCLVLLFESTISRIKITAISEIFLQQEGGGSPKIYVVFREGSSKNLRQSTRGEGGSKSQKIDLRRIWMAPNENLSFEIRWILKHGGSIWKLRAISQKRRE